MELSRVSRTELCQVADIYCDALNLQTRLRDALSARDRVCEEEIQKSRKKSRKGRGGVETSRQDPGSVDSQEKRHRVLEKLREIRIAELERRRIEIERFNQERLQEASVMAALEKERRAQEKVKIEEYRDKLVQQRKEVERVENERKVEERKKWYVLDAKNRERRIVYVFRKKRILLNKKESRICENEKKEKLNQVASSVPYFDRIQNLSIGRVFKVIRKDLSLTRMPLKRSVEGYYGICGHVRFLRNLPRGYIKVLLCKEFFRLKSHLM